MRSMTKTVRHHPPKGKSKITENSLLLNNIFQIRDKLLSVSFNTRYYMHDLQYEKKEVIGQI